MSGKGTASRITRGSGRTRVPSQVVREQQETDVITQQRSEARRKEEAARLKKKQQQKKARTGATAKKKKTTAAMATAAAPNSPTASESSSSDHSIDQELSKQYNNKKRTLSLSSSSSSGSEMEQHATAAKATIKRAKKKVTKKKKAKQPTPPPPPQPTFDEMDLKIADPKLYLQLSTHQTMHPPFYGQDMIRDQSKLNDPNVDATSLDLNLSYTSTFQQVKASIEQCLLDNSGFRLRTNRPNKVQLLARHEPQECENMKAERSKADLFHIVSESDWKEVLLEKSYKKFDVDEDDDVMEFVSTDIDSLHINILCDVEEQPKEKATNKVTIADANSSRSND